MPTTTSAATLPDVSLTTELKGVRPQFYTDIDPHVTSFLGNKKNYDAADYEKAKLIIANHLFLVHEYLNLGKTRDINYESIRNFVIKNKRLTSFLFHKMFPAYSVEVLDTWIEPTVYSAECSMYKNSNRFNKHNSH